MKFISIYGETPYPKEGKVVSLALGDKDEAPSMLGTLRHGTTILLNQALVDALQQWVNELEQRKAAREE